MEFVLCVCITTLYKFDTPWKESILLKMAYIKYCIHVRKGLEDVSIIFGVNWKPVGAKY